jgi:hypothetical protein
LLQGTEGRHAAAVDVEGVDREEVEEESVRGLRGIGDMLREVGVVRNGIEGKWIEF